MLSEHKDLKDNKEPLSIMPDPNDKPRINRKFSEVQQRLFNYHKPVNSSISLTNDEIVEVECGDMQKSFFGTLELVFYKKINAEFVYQYHFPFHSYTYVLPERQSENLFAVASLKESVRLMGCWGHIELWERKSPAENFKRREDFKIDLLSISQPYCTTWPSSSLNHQHYKIVKKENRLTSFTRFRMVHLPDQLLIILGNQHRDYMLIQKFDFLTNKIVDELEIVKEYGDDKNFFLKMEEPNCIQKLPDQMSFLFWMTNQDGARSLAHDRVAIFDAANMDLHITSYVQWYGNWEPYSYRLTETGDIGFLNKNNGKVSLPHIAAFYQNIQKYYQENILDVLALLMSNLPNTNKLILQYLIPDLLNDEAKLELIHLLTETEKKRFSVSVNAVNSQGLFTTYIQSSGLIEKKAPDYKCIEMPDQVSKSSCCVIL